MNEGIICFFILIEDAVVPQLCDIAPGWLFDHSELNRSSHLNIAATDRAPGCFSSGVFSPLTKL